MRRSAAPVLANVRLLRGVMFRMNTRLPTAVADTRLCGFTCLQQHSEGMQQQEGWMLPFDADSAMLATCAAAAAAC
jgi:hypothetical protein